MKKSMLAVLFCTAFYVAPTPAMATSQSECAIWLCLPSAFPAGCGAAFSAFKNRIKKFRPPLPPFSSCAVKNEYTDPSDFTYTHRKVLKIRKYNHEYYIYGNSCIINKGKDNEEEILGCVSVHNEVRVFEKGSQIGETFYY